MSNPLPTALCCQHSGSFQKSILLPDQNRDRQPQRTDLGIVSAGGADCYAIPVIERIGNNLELLAIHLDVHGRSESQVS